MYQSKIKNNIQVIDYRTVYVKLHLIFNDQLFEVNVLDILNIEKTNNGTLISLCNIYGKYEVNENYNDLLNTVNFYRKELELPLI